jgi:hypothetical protein
MGAAEPELELGMPLVDGQRGLIALFSRSVLAG